MLSREIYGSSPENHFTVFIYVQNGVRGKSASRNNGYR